MITKSILYNIFIFISLLIVLAVPVSSESLNTDLVWKNNDFIDNIGNRSPILNPELLPATVYWWKRGPGT